MHILYNSHRDELNEMGQNARRLAEEMFDREKLASKALARIELVSGIG